MFENRPVGIGQIAEDLNISYGSTRHIWVPESFAKKTLSIVRKIDA